MNLVEVTMNEIADGDLSHVIDNDNYNVSRNCKAVLNNMYHIHTSHEILFIESGRATYVIEGEEYKVTAGDILVIGATKRHKRMLEEEPFRRYGFTIKPSYFQSILPGSDLERIFDKINIDDYNKYHRNLNPETFCFLITLLKILSGERKNEDSYRSTMERATITQIILILYRNFGFKQLDTSRPSIYYEMQEIKNYITSHYDEELGLKFLADKFYLHPATISKSFPKYCGNNLNKFINQVRVSEVTKRLETTNDSIATIAQQCGYDSETTLSRQFKSIMDVSPAKYRKNFNGIEAIKNEL